MFNALSSKVAFDNLEDQLSGEVKVYPTLADAVTVTGHADAWTVAAYVQVVPASTITTDIFIDAVVIEAVSGADNFQVEIATGTAASEVVIARVRFNTAATSQPHPIRVKVPANTRIAARCANKANASAKTVDVSISYRVIS